jgi:hypothetical protein
VKNVLNPDSVEKKITHFDIDLVASCRARLSWGGNRNQLTVWILDLETSVLKHSVPDNV